MQRRIVTGSNGVGGDTTFESVFGKGKRIGTSIPERHRSDRPTRFETRQEFLAWLDADIELRGGEFNKERQVTRSKLIGEIGLLTKAVLVNNNPNNPNWECEFTGPGGEKRLKLIAWNEDMACVTSADDRWAFIDEMNNTEPMDSPDDLNREFIIGMDTNMNYRMVQPVKVKP